jgi:hypothetical protein
VRGGGGGRRRGCSRTCPTQERKQSKVTCSPSPWSPSGWPDGIVKKIAQAVLGHSYRIALSAEKKKPKSFATSAIFVKKLPKQIQQLNRLKFVQSGHPGLHQQRQQLLPPPPLFLLFRRNEKTECSTLQLDLQEITRLYYWFCYTLAPPASPPQKNREGDAFFYSTWCRLQFQRQFYLMTYQITSFLKSWQ